MLSINCSTKMKILTLKTKTANSKILLEESIKNISQYIKARKLIIITDENVYSYYGKLFPESKLIILKSGEKSKSLHSINTIYKKFIEFEVNKSTFILGIGGGVVTDITGFLASTFMRGIPFGFIATTLLAQVDASIGGKNGFNFLGYKNMIGTINQPEFIICDYKLLKTLPRKEFKNGLAEIVKHAIIQDYNLFKLVEDAGKNIYSLDESTINKIINKTINIKISIVKKDEKEKGKRKLLNFGHTIGHAIESVTGMSHGESIAIGMVFALNLSLKRKLISEKDFKRIILLFEILELPTKIDCDKEILIEYIKKDKKRFNNNIDFVLIDKIGKAIIKSILIDELSYFIKQK